MEYHDKTMSICYEIFRHFSPFHDTLMYLKKYHGIMCPKTWYNHGIISKSGGTMVLFVTWFLFSVSLICYNQCWHWREQYSTHPVLCPCCAAGITTGLTSECVCVCVADRLCVLLLEACQVCLRDSNLAKNKSVSLRLKAINTAKETVPHLNTHCHC